MSRFVDLLLEARANVRPMVLIASLPRNDPTLARAALDAGADVVKVHLNLQHHASGMHFGTFDEERDALVSIRAMTGDKPCGIVPGGAPDIDPHVLDQLADLGFDFLSLYLRHATAGWLPPRERMARMLAPAYGDPVELAGALDLLPVDVCELSIMAPESYGEPLTFHDLARYAAIRRVTQLPLVVPTQHKVTPAAIPELRAAGVEGLMIGAIVAGKSVESWQATTSAFRQAIDAACT